MTTQALSSIEQYPKLLVFNDVNNITQPLFCGWIERFSQLGITSGCAVNPPLYCPDDFVTRGQMAVFVTKATAVPFQKNPMQIALLKWYDAYQAVTFPVGSSPNGVAFDGASIWTANFFGGNVTKLRASDGTNLGSFPSGNNPLGIAFAGANIWVTNQSSEDVTKLRASDGVNLGTFPVGDNPVSIAFDGANIWVANQNSDNVTKL